MVIYGKVERSMGILYLLMLCVLPLYYCLVSVSMRTRTFYHIELYIHCTVNREARSLLHYRTYSIYLYREREIAHFDRFE
jgi:hypothetical protein